MIYRKGFGAFIILATLVLGGCTLSSNSSQVSKIPDGGVWKSIDAGKIWAQAINVPTATGKPANIGNVDIRRMTFDPQDSNAIYLSTESDGIVYTYDGGTSWRKVAQLNQGRIRAVAIDPKFKCTLYAIAENKLYKSNDCGRFWQAIYEHQKPSEYMTDLVIKPDNGSIIYMTDSDGNILRSKNSGLSWETIYRIKNSAIMDIIISKDDTNTIYVGTQKSGIYKSIDGGDNWESLSEGLKSYSGSHQYKELVFDPATPNGLLFISQYGMLRSADGGTTWEMIELLPAPKDATIYAMAVNPKNSQEIYYATQVTLVKSVDGGKTWSSNKLPTSRLISDIRVSPDKPNIVYLGTKLPPKK